jgi:hypothetical protein
LTTFPPVHPSALHVRTLAYNHQLENMLAWSSEGNYTRGVVPHPKYMENAGASVSAKTVFPSLYEHNRLVIPHPTGKPELGMRVRAASRPRPPKSFEWKSFPNSGFEELAQATVGGILWSFFPNSWEFYETPPFALGSLACASAICVTFCAELVGSLHFSVYAGACTVGDPQHQQLIDVLESVEVPTPINLQKAQLQSCGVVGKKAQWTSTSFDGGFYKVLRYDFPCAEQRSVHWRRLFKLYKKYEQLSSEECNGPHHIPPRTASLPPALVPARLLFGEFQVLRSCVLGCPSLVFGRWQFKCLSLMGVHWSHWKVSHRKMWPPSLMPSSFCGATDLHTPTYVLKTSCAPRSKTCT